MNVMLDRRPLFFLFILKYFKFFILLFLFVLFYIFSQIKVSSISQEGYRIILVFFLCAILWSTNIVPQAITSLLVLVLIPSLNILPVKKTFSLFGNEALFFILSAFIISAATEKSGLSKRISLLILSKGAKDANKLILFTYLLGASLSFFMPEHAVAVLILPVISKIAENLGIIRLKSSFGKLLFISLAYGTIIGGIATFLGGARNALAVGLLSEIAGVKISFLEWLRYSLPLVSLLLISGYIVLIMIFKPEAVDITSVSIDINKQLNRLSPFTFSELLTSIIILLTIIGWLIVGHSGIGLAGVSLISAILFFVFGVISWKDAEESINWSAIFMYGGALTLGATFAQTDAGIFLINKLTYLKNNFLLFALTLGIVSLLLTEFISNAAVVALVLPFSIKASMEFGYDVRVITITCALMSGLAFALPIGTPSHFVCYSSNYYTIKDSLKAGIIMNILATIFLYICIKIVWQVG